jgi:O-antigen ligase
MIDTLILSFFALFLLLGQLGRISLGNGIQFYALELLVLLHVLILLFRNATRSLRGAPPTPGQRSIPMNVSGLSVIARSLSVLLTTWQSHVDLGLLRHSLRSFLAMTTIRKIAYLWFLYVMILFIFTAWGKDFSDNLKAGMYIARVGLFAIYFYLLTLLNIQKQLMAKILWIISILIPAVCLLQYFLVPDLRFLAQFGWDPHMYRAVGLILDPPIVGVILGVLLYVAVVKRDFLALILNYSAVIFLFSRSSYLAVTFVIFVYLTSQKKYLGAILWIVVLSASIFVAPKTIPAYYNLESSKIERVSTVLSRRVEIENGFRAWATNPIFGIGYNRVAEYKQTLPRVYGEEIASNHSSSAFHSFWLTQLATTGIIGFALLMSGYLLIMKRSLNWALIMTIPALVGLLDNVIFHPFVVILFIYIYFSKTLDVKSLREYH